jgi:flagellar biosynthesis protein FlhF
MRLETFRGAQLQAALASARHALGDDAMIVRTRNTRDGVEVMAVRADELDRYRQRLQPLPLPDLASRAASRGDRPWVLALVGPTGAGKTTTLAKLAIHPQAFGGLKVGLLSLDTYRVGALEQLEILAEIARLPMEVVYAAAEVEGALQRLAGCDVVLVDTPGRSPKEPALNAEWGELLLALRPDETHLVLPAMVRGDIALAVHRAYEPFGLTHLLLSKLDEVPGDVGITSLSLALEMPSRWVTDGQEIPSDLRPAPARILASLGLQPEAAA